MSVVYSPRAVRDLEQIGTYYRSVADARIAAAIGNRIEAVIVRLEQHPLSAPQVVGRPGVRVVPVLRYPYKIFYRMTGADIEILHIRHSARLPWSTGEK